VPNRNIGGFTLFRVDIKRHNCHSTRCAPASNTMSTDSGILNGRLVLISDLLAVDISTKQSKTLKHILRCSSATGVSCELWS
jgi:hypothetical protein